MQDFFLFFQFYPNYYIRKSITAVLAPYNSDNITQGYKINIRRIFAVANNNRR
jgi:hypothetical protein